MAGDENMDFEDENGADGAKALEYTRTLNIEYNPTEVEFWFTQIETEMFTCEVKSQWLKRCVLVRNLPPKIQADVKSLLVLKKSEAPDDLYKQIKTEILRIHAPEKEETFKKALSRVMVGLPSQLGETLVNDICTKSKKLTGCCCANAIKTLWTIQLPVQVKGQVANMQFDHSTYKDVFQAADKVYLSTKATEVSAGVAAISAKPDESGEVAALRGGGRGKPPKRGQGGQNGRGSQTSNSGQGRIRHKSKPSPDCCDNHYRWAQKSWFCLSPHTCPMADKCAPRPGEGKEERKERRKIGF